MPPRQRIDIAEKVKIWLAEGHSLAIATVVGSSSSLPRGVGASLLIRDDGIWAGGLSGGCAEIEVMEVARRLLASDAPVSGPPSAVVFEMAKDTGIESTGPQCGATLTILVEVIDQALAESLTTIVDAGANGLSCRHERTYVPAVAASDESSTNFPGMLVSSSSRTSTIVTIEDQPEADHASISLSGKLELIEFIPPPPHLLIAGCSDAATDLIHLALELGWRVTVFDPRPRILEYGKRDVEARSPQQCHRVCWLSQLPDALSQLPDALSQLPDALSQLPDAFEPATQGLIDSRTACVAAAHEPRIDMPLLKQSLVSDAFFVTGIGSRKTQTDRIKTLVDEVGECAAARYVGPAGLDLGGTGSAEMALSIMAEVLARFNGRTGGPLSQSNDSIRASQHGPAS